MEYLLGHRIIIDDIACIIVDKHYQFRFPKSKKKRIRKKWSKRPANWKTTYKHVSYKTPFGFVMSRLTFEALKAEAKEINDRPFKYSC